MIEKVEWDKRGIVERGRDLFELSLVNGFMDSPASRAKVRFPSSPFFFRSRGSPISFFLHPVCSPEHRVSLTGSRCSPDAAAAAIVPAIVIRSSRLRAKVTTLYLESQLMPPPLSRDHPLIIDEPPSTPVLTQLLRNLSLPPPSLSSPPFAIPPRVLEEEARTYGKSKSVIPITRMIYRSPDVFISYISIGQRYYHLFFFSIYVSFKFFFLRIISTVQKFPEKNSYANVDLCLLRST